MNTTIVVVTYNSINIIKSNLFKLLSSSSYPIFIVDNNSSDNTVNYVKKTFPHVKIFALKDNHGYGRAANIGIKNCTTLFSLIINPDVSITENDIAKLQKFGSENNDTALIGPQIYGDKNNNENWISGCSLLVNLNHIKKIGLFDENIFLFFEETDLCNRTINKNFKIKICKDVTIKHEQGKSSDSLDLIKTKSWHYGWSKSYYHKKANSLNNIAIFMKFYLKYKLKSFTSNSKRKRKRYRFLSLGVLDFIRNKKAFDVNDSPKWFD